MLSILIFMDLGPFFQLKFSVIIKHASLLLGEVGERQACEN